MTFDTPAGSGTTATTVEFVHAGSGGTVNFGCPQLEEGGIVNAVNLLSNGDFRHSEGTARITPKDWLCEHIPAAGTFVKPPSASQCGDPFPPVLDGNILEFPGAEGESRNFYQELDISGKKGDLFFVGGWANGMSVPAAGSSDRGFRIGVKFVNGTSEDYGAKVHFNFDWVGWQYVGGPVKAPTAYDKVKVYAVYMKNSNTVQFSNFFLHREAFGKSFAYGADRNLESMGTLAGTASAMRYDAQHNMTGYREPGRESGVAHTMAYGDTTTERKQRLLKSHVTPEGIRTAYSYDTSGNRTQVRVRRDSSTANYVQTTASYGANQNYLASQTDARGNTMTQQADQNTGLVTQKTMPNGLRVNYTYDGSNRLTQVSAANTGGTVRNQYAYENDRLQSITHNTTANSADDVSYTLEYDGLGAQTKVKVGSTVLSENQYCSDRGHRLERVNYGQGGSCGYVAYQYDDFDRVTAILRDGRADRACNYEYGANGMLARATDRALGREQQVQYDLGGRPMASTLRESGGEKKRLYETRLKYKKYGALAQFAETVGEGDSYITTYDYDNDTRPTAVEFGDANHRVNYTYDGSGPKLGRLLKRAVKNGASTYTSEYSYSAGGGGSPTTYLVSGISQPGMTL